MEPVIVIGGGLAGCEAAWQIASRGGSVILYEMKPSRFSPAHRSPYLAEVVCSNSFKSESIDNAHGLLKEELKILGSFILRVALETRVPAGDCLAVDREEFSKKVTRALEECRDVEIVRREMKSIPKEGTVIVATGPLTSRDFGKEIESLAGSRLYFYDAISPIVVKESIDFGKAFMASRYGKGGNDYINCPMEEEEYYQFVEALKNAERVPIREFEKDYLFEGCLPVEELAERGELTLAHGPLKPVGLVDPRTGKRPFAVVQLRQEDRFGTLYNMVGFQTRLRHEEQKRVFRMIPGLENAEFVRLGSVHRNTYIDSPRLLNEFLQLRKDPRIFFAGQITGVEGYMESTATGLLAGINAWRFASGKSPKTPPPTTAVGSLIQYIVHCRTVPFQPMNVNFGLFQPLRGKAKKKRLLLTQRALSEIVLWKKELEADPPVKECE